jgi:hypothetical protein
MVMEALYQSTGCTGCASIGAVLGPPTVQEHG